MGELYSAFLEHSKEGWQLYFSTSFLVLLLLDFVGFFLGFLRSLFVIRISNFFAGFRFTDCASFSSIIPTLVDGWDTECVSSASSKLCFIHPTPAG